MNHHILSFFLGWRLTAIARTRWFQLFWQACIITKHQEIIQNNLNIFYKKKILIYGLGKSGLSALKFLKNFYSHRKNEPMWINDSCLTLQGENLLQILSKSIALGLHSNRPIRASIRATLHG